MLTDDEYSFTMLAQVSVNNIAWQGMHGEKYCGGHLDSVSLVLMDEVWQALSESQGELLLVAGCSCLPCLTALLPVTNTTISRFQTSSWWYMVQL